MRLATFWTNHVRHHCRCPPEYDRIALVKPKHVTKLLRSFRSDHVRDAVGPGFNKKGKDFR